MARLQNKKQAAVTTKDRPDKRHGRKIDQLIRPSVGGEIPRATSGKALFARSVPDTWLAPRMMGPLWPNSCRRGRLEVA
jgi:hypothetical protein